MLLPQEQEGPGRPPLAAKGSFTLQKRVSEADTPLMEGLDMTTLSRWVLTCLVSLTLQEDVLTVC